MGVCFFDCTTLQICLGQFEDDEQCSAMRTLVAKIRPVEVLHEREQVNSDIVRMLRNTQAPPIMTVVLPRNSWSFSKTIQKWEEYFAGAEVPSTLIDLKNRDYDLAVGCFGMTIAFLEDALIAN